MPAGGRTIFSLYAPSSCLQSMFFLAFFPLQLTYQDRSSCLPSFPRAGLVYTPTPHPLNSQYPVHESRTPTWQHFLPDLWKRSFDDVKHSTGVPISSLVLLLDFVV